MEKGRPTKYTIEIDTEICERLSQGESLTSICKESRMPSTVSVYAWLASEDHKDFLNRYIYARERQAETFIDQCVDIADDSARDTIVLLNKDGEEYEKTNFDHINRSRLRVDTRIKIAEKLAPKKYTPKHEIAGPDQGPIEVKPTDEEVLRRFAFMLRNTEEEKNG